MYATLSDFGRHHWASRFFLRPLILFYLVLLAIALFFADALIFPAPPSSYQDDPSIIKLTTADGKRISARYFPNVRARSTLRYRHGNAEDLGEITNELQELHDDGVAVFAYDYHGYGTSRGKPSEAHSYLDINAAYRYLTQTLHVPPAQIIVFGRSLGGGPSVDLASREPVGGLIMQSAFTSPFRTVTRISLLPFDEYHNDRKIAHVHCPVLIMHGMADPVIPFSHGRQLFAAVTAPKQHLWVAGAGHDDFQDVAGERYREAINDFIGLLGHGEQK